MQVKVLVHHTCMSSYALFKALKDRVQFRRVGTPYFGHLVRYVLSVPAVFVGGQLVLLDPVEPQDVEALLEGKVPDELTVEEALENVMRGIMASQALLTAVMLHRSLRPIMEPELLAVLSRARYHNRQDLLAPVSEALRRREAELLEEHWEQMAKLAALGMVRELYWLGIDVEEVEERDVKMWLLAKATVGRLGLPHPRPMVPEEVAKSIYTAIRERGQAYRDRVAQEQSVILGDEEFLSIQEEE